MASGNPGIPKGPRHNLAGHRYGRLVVKTLDNKLTPSGNYRWICLCDCGVVKSVASGELLRKHPRGVRSCGCEAREKVAAAATTHGKSKTPEYGAWSSLKKRCYDENNSSYKRYGKRGIYIDPRWDTFEQFYADMGDKPSPMHSIERVDNDGPYSPENCVWETPVTQQNNRECTVKVTIKGETKTLSQWVGGSKTSLYARALMRLKSGWCAPCSVIQPKYGRCGH